MQERGHLLRVLGLVFGLAVVVGNVVGQGILRTPGIVAEASDSTAVLLGLWALGALVALISAIPLAELGAAIPRAGGTFSFVARAFGEKAGVLMAITALIMIITSQAQLTYVLGEFLTRFGVGGGMLSPGWLGTIAIVCMSFYCALGTRINGLSQIVLSAAKGAFLIGLVAVFFYTPAAHQPETVSSGNGLLAFGIAMLVITGTYNGWADIVFFGEEIRDPGRAVPRALFGGIIAVAVLYLLVNAAILHVLTPAGAAGSEYAAADAALKAFGPGGDFVLTLFGILSVGAISILALMIATRYAYASARAGILPRVLSVVSRRGSPNLAMLAIVVPTVIFVLTGSYITIAATTISLSEVVYISIIASYFKLRKSEPEMARPWRAPWHPWPAIIAALIHLLLLAWFVWSDPANTVLGLALVGAMMLGYLLLANGKSNLAELSHVTEETS